MLSSMAFSQSDLDAIDNAIKGAELTVQFADRRVTYRSMDELMKARQLIGGEVSSSNNLLYPRYQVADFSE